MELKYISILLVILCSIPSIFALSIDDVNINIVQSDPYWQVTHQTGQEENLTVWFANAKDKKTEIGFYITEGKQYTTTDKILQYKDGTPILDDKNKPITLKYETAKCDGRNCYHISLTNAQAININDTIKLGDNSLVLEYKETQSIQYQLTNDQYINVTLYKDIGGIWNNSIDNIYTYLIDDSLKFGAIDLDNTGIERYKYTFISNRIPIEANNESIIWKECDTLKFGGNCDQTAIFFDDIVVKPFVVSVNYSEIIQDELYIGEIIFNSDADIDPKLTAGNISGCGYIDESGTYILDTSVINSAVTCIEINVSNVDFSCADGVVIDGTSGYLDRAIYSHNKVIKNISIHGCTITEWDNWISFNGVNRLQEAHIYNNTFSGLRNGVQVGISVFNLSIIENNTFIPTSQSGVYVVPSWRYNIIRNNNFSCGSYSLSSPLSLGYQSDYNLIYNNTATDCQWFVRFTHQAQYNQIFNNTILNNQYILGTTGSSSVNTNNNTFYNNIFNGSSLINYIYNTKIYMNTSIKNSTTIIGTSGYGGNIYTTPIKSGYSDNCIDSDNNNVCDSAFNVTSQNYSGSFEGLYIDSAPLTLGRSTTYEYRTGSIATSSGLGDCFWTNTNFALTYNTNFFAYCDNANADYTPYLQIDGFYFNISSDATIDGIIVTVYARGTSDMITNNFQLLKAGSPVGTDRWISGSALGSTMTNYTYGSNSDLWGTTWTPEDINNKDFGVQLRGESDINRDEDLDIGSVVIKVYYSMGGTISQNITQIENLTNISQTNDSIYVTWDKSQIPSNTSLYLDGSFIANVTTTSYNFTGLTANTQYTITGYAYNQTSVNNSISIENNISVFTLNTTIAPTIPQNITQIENLTSTSQTSNSIYVTWDKSQIPSNTSLYLDGTFIANVTTTSYNFTGLSANTQYTITGYAYNQTSVNNSISIENNISVTTKTIISGIYNIKEIKGMQSNTFTLLTYYTNEYKLYNNISSIFEQNITILKSINITGTLTSGIYCVEYDIYGCARAYNSSCRIWYSPNGLVSQEVCN